MMQDIKYVILLFHRDSNYKLDNTLEAGDEIV